VADSNRLHSINTSRILRAIWLNPGVSRIKVAEMLDLDRSTVTKIMQVILDRGLVVTAGKNTEQSGVGRRQINLEVNEDIGVVLGMEIQDSRYNAVVTTISGKVVSAFSACAQTKKENLVDRIAGIVATAKKHLAGTKYFLLGAGVGLPGIIDPYTGRIIRSHSFGVDEPFDLLEALDASCDAHIIIENDANSCCWGDLAFKRESRTRNFMTVLGEFREDASGFAGCHGLAIGIGIVIVVYLGVTGTYLGALGRDGLALSAAPAGDTAARVGGAAAATAMTVALLVRLIESTDSASLTSGQPADDVGTR